MTSEVINAAERIQEESDAVNAAVPTQIVAILGWLKERAHKLPRKDDYALDWLACDYLSSAAQTAFLLHYKELSNALKSLILIASVDGFKAVIEQLPQYEEQAIASTLERISK